MYLDGFCPAILAGIGFVRSQARCIKRIVYNKIAKSSSEKQRQLTIESRSG